MSSRTFLRATQGAELDNCFTLFADRQLTIIPFKTLNNISFPLVGHNFCVNPYPEEYVAHDNIIILIDSFVFITE